MHTEWKVGVGRLVSKDQAGGPLQVKIFNKNLRKPKNPRVKTPRKTYPTGFVKTCVQSDNTQQFLKYFNRILGHVKIFLSHPIIFKY